MAIGSRQTVEPIKSDNVLCWKEARAAPEDNNPFNGTVQVAVWIDNWIPLSLMAEAAPPEWCER